MFYDCHNHTTFPFLCVLCPHDHRPPCGVWSPSAPCRVRARVALGWTLNMLAHTQEGSDPAALNNRQASGLYVQIQHMQPGVATHLRPISSTLPSPRPPPASQSARPWLHMACRWDALEDQGMPTLAQRPSMRLFSSLSLSLFSRSLFSFPRLCEARSRPSRGIRSEASTRVLGES